MCLFNKKFKSNYIPLFNIGDIVILKSGSPKMTVLSPDNYESDYVTCEWFTTSILTSKLQSGVFHKQILKKF